MSSSTCSRDPSATTTVLYASHTIWRLHADFEAWTRSEAFRAAHRDAGRGRALTISHPEFEGFEVIQTVALPAPGAATEA